MQDNHSYRAATEDYLQDRRGRGCKSLYWKYGTLARGEGEGPELHRRRWLRGPLIYLLSPLVLEPAAGEACGDFTGPIGFTWLRSPRLFPPSPRPGPPIASTAPPLQAPLCPYPAPSAHPPRPRRARPAPGRAVTAVVSLRALEFSRSGQDLSGRRGPCGERAARKPEPPCSQEGRSGNRLQQRGSRGGVVVALSKLGARGRRGRSDEDGRALDAVLLQQLLPVLPRAHGHHPARRVVPGERTWRPAVGTTLSCLTPPPSPGAGAWKQFLAGRAAGRGSGPRKRARLPARCLGGARGRREGTGPGASRA